MSTVEKRIYDGNRAREVLENEAFIGAFTEMKQEIIEQWTKSPARDQEGREKLWSLLKLADKLELILKTSIDTGKLASLDMEYKQKLADRAKAALGLN